MLPLHLLWKKKTQFQTHIILPTFKLIWECGTRLSPGTFKNGTKNALNVWKSIFLTPCIISHFQLISKTIGNFFNGYFFGPKLNHGK